MAADEERGATVGMCRSPWHPFAAIHLLLIHGSTFSMDIPDVTPGWATHPFAGAGRSVESWTLKDIKRDNFPPNSGGLRMWQAERKKWQAERLTGIMKEAGLRSCVCVQKRESGRESAHARVYVRAHALIPLLHRNARAARCVNSWLHCITVGDSCNPYQSWGARDLRTRLACAWLPLPSNAP